MTRPLISGNCFKYCAEGKNERFGVIEFAVGVDVTTEFKRAVAEIKACDWHPLEREVAGKILPTGQEWAEVCFVPNWTAQRKDGPTYRFLAIRELLEQAELPELEVQLPFPSMTFGEKRYKLFGLVTNRDIPGDELIWWHRKRCGKGEEMHKIMKEDLAGGHLPSARFGANAAWWGIMVLAFNLNSLMKRLVLPKEWAPKRLKAIRSVHLIRGADFWGWANWHDRWVYCNSDGSELLAAVIERNLDTKFDLEGAITNMRL